MPGLTCKAESSPQVDFPEVADTMDSTPNVDTNQRSTPARICLPAAWPDNVIPMAYEE